MLPEGRVTEEALLPPVTRGAGKRFGTYLLDPPTTIKSSTISGNTASPNGGGTGGGIYNWDGLTVIAFSTVANNSAANGKGSGIASYGEENDYGESYTRTELSGTIVAGNVNTDVDFVTVGSSSGTTNSFQSNGLNLIGTGNAADYTFSQYGDPINVLDPGLEPLADNGGHTKTHALLGRFVPRYRPARREAAPGRQRRWHGQLRHRSLRER